MANDAVSEISWNPVGIELQNGVPSHTNALAEALSPAQSVNSFEGSPASADAVKQVEWPRVASPEMTQTQKRQSILEWYFVLRTHHQWTVFQAIRYALWLAR